jgi:predicted metal-dependent hydrolase
MSIVAMFDTTPKLQQFLRTAVSNERATAGNLNFNDEPLSLDRELGDYVIVHELLHFSVPNQGKLWKSRMLAHLGDHEHLAERLRRVAYRSFCARS